MIIPADKVTTRDVQSWKGLHLLHFQGSTCSQKVRLMLGELGRIWTSHPVSLIKHENATPWFLGINPRGVVPVLVHDGIVHVESNDIITYLDETFARPGESYFFEPGTAAAEESQHLLDLEDSLHTALRLLTIQFGPLSIKSEQQIDAQENNGAQDEKRAHEVSWWRDKASNGISAEETRVALAQFAEAFRHLDDRLADRDWLMGERISIVDISWYVNLQRLVRLGYPLSRHGHLAALYERLAQRPAFTADERNIGSKIGKGVFGLTRMRNKLQGKRISHLL